MAHGKFNYVDEHIPIFNKIRARNEVRAVANIDDRMKLIERFLEQDSNSRILRLERARAHIELNNLDLARRDLDLVTDIATSDPEGFFIRGYVHYKLGNDDKALFDLTKAIELGVRRSDCFYLRALLFFSSGAIRNALEDLEECIHQETTHWEARSLMIRGLSIIGRRLQAKGELETLLKANPSGKEHILSDPEMLALNQE